MNAEPICTNNDLHAEKEKSRNEKNGKRGFKEEQVYSFDVHKPLFGLVELKQN